MNLADWYWPIIVKRRANIEWWPSFIQPRRFPPKTNYLERNFQFITNLAARKDHWGKVYFLFKSLGNNAKWQVSGFEWKMPVFMNVVKTSYFFKFKPVVKKFSKKPKIEWHIKIEILDSNRYRWLLAGTGNDLNRRKKFNILCPL